MLCPERDYLASLSDGEFWEYVLCGVRPGERPLDDYYDDDPPEDLLPACEECGATGACGYDDEGRAMVHVTSPDEA